jgi:hypothetical protein
VCGRNASTARRQSPSAARTVSNTSARSSRSVAGAATLPSAIGARAQLRHVRGAPGIADEGGRATQRVRCPVDRRAAVSDRQHRGIDGSDRPVVERETEPLADRAQIGRPRADVLDPHPGALPAGVVEHVGEVPRVVQPRREAAGRELARHMPVQPAHEVRGVVGPGAHAARGDVEPVPRVGGRIRQPSARGCWIEHDDLERGAGLRGTAGQVRGSQRAARPGTDHCDGRRRSHEMPGQQLIE